MNGQVSKSQSDIHLESAHDSAALVHEGNIMKRVELGCGTQAPATKSRAMLGATKLAQNSALGNTLRLMRVTRAFANLPAPQALHATADVAPGDGEAVPAGHGTHTAGVEAPIALE